MTRLRWLWLAPIAFVALRVLGSQFVEEAVDQRVPPRAFASTLLADAELFSVGMYLAGLAGLAFLWFAWALRERLRHEGAAGPAEAMAFGAAVLWGTLYVAATALAATAPVLADYYDDPEGARLVTNLDFATAPLALTLVGAFALGNGLALRRASLVPQWLASTGAVVGVLLVVTAALQTIVEPTVSRSEEEVDNVVSFLTGFASFALVPFWTIAVGVALFRRDGRTAAT
jgi:hypothetical protein